MSSERALWAAGLALLLLVSAGEPPAAARPAPAAAQVHMTVEEALALAFGDAAVERGTVYLTDGQRARIEELAGSELGSAIVHPYVALKDGALVGTAWIDTHRVRTLRQSVLVVVAPDRTVRRVELLAFAEPAEYVPRARWYGQFAGRRLDEELDTRRAIRGVSGATLTARATTAAVRRALALQEVVGSVPPTPGAGQPRSEAERLRP